MGNFNLNILVIVILAVSGFLIVYPLIENAIDELGAERVLSNFKKIGFALNLYFYTEGFEVLEPSKVSLETLVNRYYLVSDPGREYSIFWIDTDVEDDGEIKAVVYYKGFADPVAIKKLEKNIVWFSSGRISKNYSNGSNPGIVVEVKKTW